MDWHFVHLKFPPAQIFENDSVGGEFETQAIGEARLLRFASDLENLGKVEQMPVLEGKRMTIMLTPLKQPAKKEKAPESRVAKPAEETPSEENKEESSAE